MFCSIEPPFRDKHFFLRVHCVANPATNLTKHERGHSAEMQKKNTNTQQCRRNKNALSALSKCCLKRQVASFEALLSLEKQKNINDPTPSWSSSVFASCRAKHDIRQPWAISMFSRITSDTHVPLKIFGESRNGCNFGTKKKKPRRTSPWNQP